MPFFFISRRVLGRTPTAPRTSPRASGTTASVPAIADVDSPIHLMIPTNTHTAGPRARSGPRARPGPKVAQGLEQARGLGVEFQLQT